MDIDDAVEKAITECIEAGILSDFLRKNRAEAKKMSIYEYNEEKQRRLDRAEGFEEGSRIGFEKGSKAGQQTAQIEAVKNLMETMNLNLSKAMEALKIPKVEQEEIRAYLL